MDRAGSRDGSINPSRLPALFSCALMRTKKGCKPTEKAKVYSLFLIIQNSTFSLS
jgi:hypothetical protein